MTRLRIAGLAVVGALAAGAFGPRSAYVDWALGIEQYREFPPAVFAVAAAAVLALLLVPRLADLAAAGLGRLAGRVPARLALPLLAVAAGAAFLLLTNRRISGDAMTIVLFVLEGQTHPSNPLTTWLHMLLARLPGSDAYHGVRLLSVISGVVFTFVAVAVGRLAFPDRARRAGLAALLLTCGAAALFFGTIEVYPPLAAGTLAYLYLGLRRLRGRGGLAAPAAALGVTFALHGAAGLLLPSLLLLANDGRIRPLRPRQWLAAGAAFLVPVLLVFAGLFFVAWGGKVPPAGPARTGTFLGAMGQSPLLPLLKTARNLDYRYALLDADHLAGVASLVLLAAPVGLALLLLFPRTRRDPTERFVLAAAAFLVLFPLLWNVSYSLRRDWDLFAAMGVPIALLGGLRFLAREERRGPILAAVALSLFAFVPLVVANARAPFADYAVDVARAWRLASVSQPDRAEEYRRAAERFEARAEADPDPEIAYHSAADRYVAAGNRPAAVATVREGLRALPHCATLSAHLGMLLVDSGRKEQARAAFLYAVRESPAVLGAWAALARLAMEDGDAREAVRLLERGIRVSSRHRMAPEARALLAEARQRAR